MSRTPTHRFMPLDKSPNIESVRTLTSEDKVRLAQAKISFRTWGVLYFQRMEHICSDAQKMRIQHLIEQLNHELENIP